MLLVFFALALYHVVSFPSPENKSYSSVRTEALTVVDLIVKRTGGKSHIVDVILIELYFYFMYCKNPECFLP